jgi:transitional endoplasmic reticulum ATPase
MAKDKKTIDVINVVRHGEALVVPESMDLLKAAAALERQHEAEEEIVFFQHDIRVFPWEGALALKQALTEVFGYAEHLGSWGWFGRNPPQEIAVEIGPNETIKVPFGQFAFPLAKDNDSEYFVMGHDKVDGMVVFQLAGYVRRKYLPQVDKVVAKVKEIVDAKPLYKGKAFTIDFAAKPVPAIRFVDLSGIDVTEIVFTQELTNLIADNILTPIKHTEAVKAAGIPLKRGVLLAGPYGTGKSLLARGIAKTAQENGWTFLYLKEATQLPQAIHFAKQYQPTVIFAEDIDRTVSGERTSEMDKILNTLDGIDTKTTQVMVVLTTNHLDQINQAMLRPGRLDVILKVTPPDAEAVQRLIGVYAKGRLEIGTDLSEAGRLLDGYTAAVVREVVERAKLMTISRTGSAVALMTGDDVVRSAQTMVQQQNLLRREPVKLPEWHNGFIQAIGSQVVDSFKANGLATMEEEVSDTLSITREIQERVDNL